MRKILCLLIVISLVHPNYAAAKSVQQLHALQGKIDTPQQLTQLKSIVQHMTQRMMKATPSEKRRLEKVIDALYEEYYYAAVLPDYERRKWKFFLANEKVREAYWRLQQLSGRSAAQTAKQTLDYAYYVWWAFHEKPELPNYDDLKPAIAQFERSFETKAPIVSAPIEAALKQALPRQLAFTAEMQKVRDLDEAVVDNYVKQLFHSKVEQLRQTVSVADADNELSKGLWREILPPRFSLKLSEIGLYGFDKYGHLALLRIEQEAEQQLTNWWGLDEIVPPWEREWFENFEVYPEYMDIVARRHWLKRPGAVSQFYLDYRSLSTSQLLAVCERIIQLTKSDKWIQQSIVQANKHFTYYGERSLHAPMDIAVMKNDLVVYQNAYDTRMKQWKREIEISLKK